MSHIFLTGFMGSGKSTVGRLLAGRLRMPFLDVDSVVEDKHGCSVKDIFARDGEEVFRRSESDVLRTLAEAAPAVVACGGGIVLRDENRALLRQEGTVVYLAVSAEEALARIGDDTGRPLLMGEAARMATTLLDARRGLYESVADVIVDTAGRSAGQVAEEVLAALIDAGWPDTPQDLEERCVVSVATRPSYEVVIGPGALSDAGHRVRLLTRGGRAAIVSDETVWRLFGEATVEALTHAGFEVVATRIPPGEGSKTWHQAGAVLETLAEAGLDREDIVIALGGGVVGDLAGFCAATYMRGIAYVQLPTTLLAQVDSSIGGKTAVDLPAGKNLAGAFTQPSLVLTDTSVLPTLSEDDWRSGLAEIAKTAVLAGEEQLSWLEGTADALVRREPGPVSYAVCMCVRFKAAVVSSDEREAGGRECLNLGHTLGHAIENVAGYGVVPHGVAVAEGMRFSVGLAESLGARPAWSKRVGRLLDSLDLEAQDLRLDPRALRRAMSADKKSRGGHVRFVLASAPGVWECSIVDEDLLTEHLAIWVRGDLPETRG